MFDDNMLEFFHISLLYRLLALQVMLGEANFFTHQLELPEVQPLQVTNIENLFVASPAILDFCGNLKSAGYAFGFGDGILRGVRQRKSEEWFLAQYPLWAQQPSSIDRNDAYRMATQWL